MIISNRFEVSTPATIAGRPAQQAPAAQPAAPAGPRDQVSLSGETAESETGSPSTNALLSAWGQAPATATAPSAPAAAAPASDEGGPSAEDLSSSALQLPSAVVDAVPSLGNSAGGRAAGRAGTAGTAISTYSAANGLAQGEDVAQNSTTLASSASQAGVAGANALAGRRAQTRAARAFRQAAPGASRVVTSAAARQAAASARAGRPSGLATLDTTRAGRVAARRAPGTFAQNLGTANRRLGQSTLRTASNGASSAATSYLANSRLLRLSRGVGRAIPGLNAVSAAFDVRQAYRSATTGTRCRAITDGITAAGSLATLVPHPYVALGGVAAQVVGMTSGAFCRAPVQRRAQFGSRPGSQVQSVRVRSRQQFTR